MRYIKCIQPLLQPIQSRLNHIQKANRILSTLRKHISTTKRTKKNLQVNESPGPVDPGSCSISFVFCDGQTASLRRIQRRQAGTVWL